MPGKVEKLARQICKGEKSIGWAQWCSICNIQEVATLPTDDVSAGRDEESMVIILHFPNYFACWHLCARLQKTLS